MDGAQVIEYKWPIVSRGVGQNAVHEIYSTAKSRLKVSLRKRATTKVELATEILGIIMYVEARLSGRSQSECQRRSALDFSGAEQETFPAANISTHTEYGYLS